MSERVSNKTAEEHLRLLEAAEVKYEGILPGSCPHIDALRDLLDSRARAKELEEAYRDILSLLPGDRCRLLHHNPDELLREEER
jgi:hypothetical protein